jgi:hypothetical protein
MAGDGQNDGQGFLARLTPKPGFYRANGTWNQRSVVRAAAMTCPGSSPHGKEKVNYSLLPCDHKTHFADRLQAGPGLSLRAVSSPGARNDSLGADLPYGLLPVFARAHLCDRRLGPGNVDTCLVAPPDQFLVAGPDRFC